MSENAIAEMIENIEPPEVKLTVPELAEITETSDIQMIETIWLVVAKNRRVNRDWEALIQRNPENARRCYKDLCIAHHFS
jgi:hypothetical protein